MLKTLRESKKAISKADFGRIGSIPHRMEQTKDLSISCKQRKNTQFFSYMKVSRASSTRHS